MRSGQLKAYAVMGKRRVPEVPEIPTAEELGASAFPCGRATSCSRPAGPGTTTAISEQRRSSGWTSLDNPLGQFFGAIFRENYSLDAQAPSLPDGDAGARYGSNLMPSTAPPSAHPRCSSILTIARASRAGKNEYHLNLDVLPYRMPELQIYGARTPAAHIGPWPLAVELLAKELAPTCPVLPAS